MPTPKQRLTHHVNRAIANGATPITEKPSLECLHERASRLLAQFQALIPQKFPGKDQHHWSRACAAIRGDNVRRNDDQSQDAALADDQGIAQAYDTYIEALHVFYRARDGEKGFLGSRGL